MVKHGRNKKRRAGRIGRTKLKNRNFSRWNPKPTFTDRTVSKLWDVTKSPQVNLTQMGLSLEPNNVNRGNTTTANSSNNGDQNNRNKKPNMIELFDVPESDELNNNNNKAATRLPVQEEEQDYIVKCMEKYGTNYRAMFRDVKVNNLQHTEGKLRKLGARFLLLHPDQIAVQDIPENVLALMEHATTKKEDDEESTLR